MPPNEAGATPVERIIRCLADLVAYGLVSVAALATDYGLLVLLVSGGTQYLLASLASFLAGSLVSYMLCVRFVFASRRGASRDKEIAGFFTVGLLGLGLTQILLYILVSKAGLSIALAKIPVVGIVFFFNFVCRRRLVFAAPGGGYPSGPDGKFAEFESAC